MEYMQVKSYSFFFSLFVCMRMSSLRKLMKKKEKIWWWLFYKYNAVSLMINMVWKICREIWTFGLAIL